MDIEEEMPEPDAQLASCWSFASHVGIPRSTSH
jgi:hypothetical protein